MRKIASKNRGLSLMHLATVLFGFTAILGKQISIDEFSLVWYRMLFAGAVFLFFPSVWKHLKRIKKLQFAQFCLIGIIIALHWVTFYGSIKIADNASLALACFGLVTLFTAILEPLLTASRFKKKEILLGIAALLGILIIAMAKPKVNAMKMQSFNTAIVWGIGSALLASLFSVLNKKWLKSHEPKSASCIQLLAGWLFLGLLLPFIGDFYTMQWSISIKDWLLILCLAVLCTSIAYGMELTALKTISAFKANLIINLEPIYGMLLAAVIFNEYKELNVWFYLGAAIILMSVFAHPLLVSKTKGDGKNA